MIARFAPDAPLPRQVLVEATVASRRLADPAGAVAGQLARLLAPELLRGRRIAIGAGSRGIDRIAEVVRATVTYVREHGGDPFIVPVMGNHGGATDIGQAGILEGIGITERSVGAPIRPRMDTREVGRTAADTPVFVAEEALAADGVILVNRIKPHTDFESDRVGSGLVKMSAIGIGKSEGAAACHRAALKLGLEAVLPAVSQVVRSRLNLLCGIALVEDGRHQLSSVDVIPSAAIDDREAELLAQARALMPALPFPRIDVLVIDRIGKDISGAGMDPNIIGRGINGQPFARRRVDVGAIYVRGLTPASHGNAIGVGMADVVSRALVDEMDPEAVFTNALSSVTPVTAKTPMYFSSDRDCLTAAMRFSGADADRSGIVRIQNTLALDRFVASETYLDEIRGRSDLRIASDPLPWTFDAHGNLDADHDPMGPSHDERAKTTAG
jgi:Domain of unknown function (DUF362)